MIDCSVTMKTITTRASFNRSRTTISLVTFLKASQSVTAMTLKSYSQDYHSSEHSYKMIKYLQMSRHFFKKMG